MVKHNTALHGLARKCRSRSRYGQQDSSRRTRSVGGHAHITVSDRCDWTTSFWLATQLLRANRWSQQQLKEWGLKNAHLEGFEFGRGWSYDSASINLISPRKTSLHGIPVAWTPGTDGTIEGEVIFLDAVTTQELEPYKGRLEGKIVFAHPTGAIR